MPDTGGELANIVAHVGVDIGKETIKATGEIAKNLLLMLIKNQQEKARVKAGKTNLQKLLKSGEEIKMADLSKEDLHNFNKKSKPYAITYAVISEEDKELYTVMFKAGEEERVKKVLEDMLKEKVKVSEQDQNENHQKEQNQEKQTVGEHRNQNNNNEEEKQNIENKNGPVAEEREKGKEDKPKQKGLKERKKEVIEIRSKMEKQKGEKTQTKIKTREKGGR